MASQAQPRTATRSGAPVEEEAVVALLRTTGALRRKLSRLLEPAGISMQQYNVLRILRAAGKGGLPTLEVVERLIEDTPAITRLVDKLEAKAFVSRVRDAKDRRVVYCAITSAGLDILARLDEPVIEADKSVMSRLGKGELKHLLQMLEKINAAAQSGPDVFL